LTRENKNIHVFGQKAPISLAIEIGNRFITLTKNCFIIIVQYDNMVEFLEVFHHEEQRVLIQYLIEEKKNFIKQMGTIYIIFRCLIIPFWSTLSKNQPKRVYYESIENFKLVCTDVVAASNPLIKLLEIGKQHQSDNLYKLACDEINKYLDDEESLVDMKQMGKNGVTACIEYIAQITKNKELTSSADEDLISATNTKLERLFGLMNLPEPTKFNLRKKLFSFLNCCEFNKTLPILSTRDDWNVILDNAVESTKAHVNSLMEAEMKETI
jgi:hypothetical protein